MRNRVLVVTGYCDLGLNKRPSTEFHALGQILKDTLRYKLIPMKVRYERLWLSKCTLRPANARAPDRFDNEYEHRRSNIVQHMPIQCLTVCDKHLAGYDVFVWLGYSICKQGHHTGKLIEPAHLIEFVSKVEAYDFDKSIPFPGILPAGPIDPYGDNWRFCGSTIIIPKKFMSEVRFHYMRVLMGFLAQYQAVPLDLAIWPEVERTSGLPWHFYKAEYDHTQLSNFPG